MFSRAILLSALLLNALSVALVLSACGGPLRVTAGEYDRIRVNAEQRANVERAEAAAAEAKKKSDEAAAALDAAEDAELERLQLTHARWRAEAAEKAWLVALAELELRKHDAAQGKGGEDEQLRRELEDQLFDLRNQHAAAMKSLAASTEDLNGAKAAGADNPY